MASNTTREYRFLEEEREHKRVGLGDMLVLSSPRYPGFELPA